MGSTSGSRLLGGLNATQEIVSILDKDKKIKPHKNNKKNFGCFTICVMVRAAQNHINVKIGYDKLMLGNCSKSQSFI